MKRGEMVYSVKPLMNFSSINNTIFEVLLSILAAGILCCDIVMVKNLFKSAVFTQHFIPCILVESIKPKYPLLQSRVYS